MNEPLRQETLDMGCISGERKLAIAKYKGMRTNSGCHCLDHIDKELRMRIERKLWHANKQIAELRDSLEFQKQLSREYVDKCRELRELYDLDTQTLRAERDEARERHTQTILEKDRWQAMAEQKWGLRREVEALLGVESGACSDAQFEKGVEALRKVIADNAALKQRVCNLEYSNESHRQTAESWRAAAVERDALRDALRVRIDAIGCTECDARLRFFGHAKTCSHYATEKEVMQ